MWVQRCVQGLLFLLCGLMGAPGSALAEGSTETAQAEIAFVNGHFYTVDESRPWVEAVAVADGKFIAVGATADVKGFVGPSTEVIDLHGQFVMPGLHDAHTHIELNGSKWTYWCNVSQSETPAQFVAALQDCASRKKPDEWLLAATYSPVMFPEEQVTRDYLDRYFPDRPVFIVEHSWHHGLGNSKALEIAEIDDLTPDPPAGTIVRDEHGRATGELVENAVWLLKRRIPPPDPVALRKLIKWVLASHGRYGVTSVQDAGTTKQVLEELQALDREEGLPLRVAAHLVWGQPALGEATREDLDRLVMDRAEYASEWVDTDFVKLVIDGSPMPPHSNHADLDPETGLVPEERLLLAPDVLNRTVARFDRLGIKVKMHCVGTGAARAALDAIEYTRAENGNSGIGHEIAHSVWYSEADLPRVAALGAVAEMSPAIWHHGWPGMEEAFPFPRLLESGALLTAGTDWVILPNPNLLPALEGMLTRQGHEIPLETGIRILTINGARSVGKEDVFGSIEVGKQADMAVLDQNLFEIPAERIGESLVLMTVFAGEIVYRADN
ncbi:amidohydrolase [Elongatibacter sediminis]|uniref:Amidohydrolase n=1 Tax=Elongatibacter sediminis TaxID=3119006 RepID=A0AAW9RH78_9GAMM